ncbi:MAG TPA: hypothetical protein VH062_12640 [Polyangiaceae bacterium]|jgi:hypothetical protein|nr:hypothetical protein [Polyangiaceae bacterium]
MRLIKMTGLLVAGAMTLGVFSVAAARTGSVLSPTASLFGAPTAAIEAPREVDLPPEQQMTLAHGYISRMDQSVTTVRSALEQARAARDVVKTLCLNDKLNQIDVASRSGKDRATTLSAAVSGHDKDRARHEFMILQVLKDRVDQLVKEANQCIGEEAGFIGESQVSLTIDPNIPDNNTDQLGNDPEIISEPPVLASPPL